MEAIIRVACYFFAEDFGVNKHEKRVLESIKKFVKEPCLFFKELHFYGHSSYAKRFREK